MQLSITERLLLLTALPKEANLVTIRLVRELRDALSFSEQEHEELGLTLGPSGANWKQEKNDHKKDVEIGPTMLSLIKTSLKALDNQKKLTEAHISLYERFVGNDE